MPSLLQNASSNAFDSSILTLQATFSSGMTLLTTASTANNFLRATDGPFAELKELVAQHTSIKDRPQFQPLVPPDQIVKGIVQKIWGHPSIETVGDIGDILEKGLVTDDLSLKVFLEVCIAGYAQKKGKSPQEVMKSQEAACLHKLQQQDIDRKCPDQAEEAKAFYDKILVHCGDLVLSKDEREAQPNEGLYLLQKITGKYAAQVYFIHPVGVALVGFIADDKLAPRDSTIAFTSSPMIVEMVKAMGLPLTEDSALAMRNFYDGIKAFSPYQPDAIKQRTFLQHLGAFTNPDKSTSEVFGASSLMKTVVMHMKQSVHFSDDLDRYLGNRTGNMAIKSEVEGNANDMDYHTPALKRKEGLTFADKTYSSHPQRCTELEATGITELGHNWRVANILSFMLEHRLHFVGWHRGVPRLNKSLLCDWTPSHSPGSGADVEGGTNDSCTPNSPTVEMEGDSRHKKSKATRACTLTKAKPPHVTPGGHNQMKEAVVPENEVKGPQDDGIVPETPPCNSPEPGGSSSSSVKLEAINLTTFPSGVCSGFQQGHGPQLPADPENDVFVGERDQVISQTIREGSPGLPHLDITESNILGTVGGTVIRIKPKWCAQNSGWRAASKMLPVVHLKALMEENVELLVNIDIIALHVTEKEPPPEVLDVAQHWRMISTVGNELCDRGADVGKVARRVVQLLDELEVNDDEDVIATWIQMLPS
ncbi:uncharacterized protein EI90DRAFT_3015629 [Cantharellus anzutake]|uniref:uncharacterized protein n=1 Tax=Cantharellus anzutake TaxID=1750568 RepID=UPI001907F018|nr:uncharacterized protein EI90DRAFT_3015629 [Cantharellus anzutake]KAF8333215.1 hypothetical protein EI90DRAFT_3015629 [Cantharellus anzutake]